MPRKPIKYDFFYNGTPITKSNFLNGIGAKSDNWKRKCVRNRYGEWTYGYYRATPKD